MQRDFLAANPRFQYVSPLGVVEGPRGPNYVPLNTEGLNAFYALHPDCRAEVLVPDSTRVELPNVIEVTRRAVVAQQPPTQIPMWLVAAGALAVGYILGRRR